MLSARDIHFRIGSKTLLDGINAEFRPGLINLIIGPNGAGKSTLIKVLSAQWQAASGAVYYDKKDSRHIPAPGLARIRALLSQNVTLAFPLSVEEVVMMGRYPFFSYRPSGYDRDICQEAMRFFDVSGFSQRNYQSLSGGEMQRVHFARVAAQIWDPPAGETRYLLLDEPLTYLDIYYQIDFMDKLKELVARQKLVVAGVVHDLNLAAKYADKLTLLQDGKMLASGSGDEVLTPEWIREAYRVQAEIVVSSGSRRLFF